MKGKLQTERTYLQITYLAKALNVKYTENSQNSVLKKKIQL